MSYQVSSSSSQSGISLVVSLLMLIAVAMLGISAAQIAMQAEKASRNDRDRQLAFQAAEAALLDAELDIENSPDAARSRSNYFDRFTSEGFSTGCGSGEANIFLGLCAGTEASEVPAWLSVDLRDAAPTTTRSVPYGKFTGLHFPVGEGALPARLPRYIIELISYNAAGESADATGRSYFYRITAVGFGVREQTQVVLQSFFRKEG